MKFWHTNCSKNCMKVFKLVSSILMMSFAASCGITNHFDKVKKPAGYVRQFSTTDETFNAYIKKFEDHAKIKTGNVNYKLNDIPINFGDTENERFVGVCFTYSDGKKEVIIKADWWNKVPPSSRESLIFHELGHCALDREHNEDMIVNGKGEELRASIMHPSIVSAQAYSEYYDGYVHELFTNDRGILSGLFK